MYPLSFTRLKNIQHSPSAFIAGCVAKKKPSTKEQMLGRVIHRALLFGDYKTFCAQEIDASMYPDTISEMQELVGKLKSGAKKDDYEEECAKAGIVTLSAAKANLESLNKDTYSAADMEMIDGIVEVAGDRFIKGDKEIHLETEVLHGFLDWKDETRITDIKTYRSTGKGFYSKCASEFWLEQLALYGMIAGNSPSDFSIYAVEIGEGFTTSQEFVFPFNSVAMQEAFKRVNRWLKEARMLEKEVLKAIEAGGTINVRLDDTNVTDSDLPIWFYKEQM